MPLPLLRAAALAALLVFPAVASAQEGPDLTLRVDQLEEQNRNLTGRIEELQHEVQVLGDQLKRMQGDFEFRLDDLEGHGRGRPGTPPARRSDAGPAGAPAGIPDNSAHNPDRPAPGETNLGRLDTGRPDRGGGIVDDSGGGPLVITPNLPQGSGSASPPPSANPGQPPRRQVTAGPTNSPDDELALARGYLERRNYDDAEMQFKDFLSTYPRDPHVADALYGLGESFYMRKRYNDALEPFLKLVTDHSGAPRAADGMVRLGQTLAAINQKEQACATFNAIARKFPRAAGARADAAREMQRDGC